MSRIEMKQAAHFIHRRDGVALIEFVLVLPMLLILFFGAAELTRYIIITQKVEKAAFGLANVTTQYDPATTAGKSGEISTTALNSGVFPRFQELMSPYDAAQDRAAIITSIQREQVGLAQPVRIKWQTSGGGGFSGSDVRSSINGASPGATAQPNTVITVGQALDPEAQQLHQMAVNENTVAIEVFYNYQPMLQNILVEMGVNIPPTTIRRAVYMHPRKGPFTCLPTMAPC